MELVKSAELLAKKKHAGQFRKDGITPYSKHLEDVVNRLKSLGVTDEEILCSGWLHDTIEDTDTSFDNLYEQFGSRIAVLVSTLSKDMKLSRKQREKCSCLYQGAQRSRSSSRGRVGPATGSPRGRAQYQRS